MVDSGQHLVVGQEHGDSNCFWTELCVNQWCGFARDGGKSHMFKSQASLKSQYKQLKQVKSSQRLTSSKSSRVLI